MKSVLLAAASVAAMSGGAWAQVAPPPASAFGRIPAVQDIAISPNGQTIATLGGSPTQRMLTFATIDKPGLPILDLGAVKALSVDWVGDNYAVAQIELWHEGPGPKSSYAYARDISITPEGKAVARFLDGDPASQAAGWLPVIGTTQGSAAKAIVLGLRDSTGAEGGQDTRLKRKGERQGFVPALLSVDPATGKGALLEKGDFDTWNWEVDLTGEARVREDTDDITHRFSLFARPKGTRPWKSIVVNQDEEAWVNYLGYSDPEDAIYLGQPGAEGDQVMRRRLSDGALEAVGHPGKGLSVSVVWDPRRKAAIGLASGGEKLSIEWLDAELGGVHTALSKVFKSKTVSLYDWSEDRTRFLVRVDAQASPAEWYLFDKARKELSPLGEEYPELKGVALGRTKWLTYKARDGLDIPAYLTLPPGASETGAKAPLIVLPHGGPRSRDDNGFDWLTQFLATRGYAVLRPQFRGSTGFGRAFELAGRGEWGGKMQTDLLDGIAAVASSGDADPARVCIVGWSFGGYAALAGATLHPEAYKCAASIAGISDLGLLLKEELQSTGSESASMRDLRRLLAGASPAMISATSPLQNVASVRAPVLLVHADRDRVVEIEQSEKMAAALKTAGKQVDFVTIKDDDHGLAQSASRTQLLETLETFLAKNLPVKP
jgi:dipeptidyl aminopeptidase/acylaminoacyl peptidase